MSRVVRGHSTAAERKPKMNTRELDPIMNEIEAGLADLWESALTARNAADEVLKKKQALAMRITQIRTEVIKAEIAKREKVT